MKKLKTKPANYQQPLGKFLTARDTSSCLESDNTDTGQTSALLFSPAAVGSLEGSSPIHLSGEGGEQNNIIAVQSLMSHPHETSKPQAESSQIFQEAPPSKAIVPIGGGAHCNGVIDWSREARAKRLLVIAGSDINQTLITQYYSIVDEIERLTQNNEVLSPLRIQESNALSFSPVLLQMLNAMQQYFLGEKGIQKYSKSLPQHFLSMRGHWPMNFCNATCIRPCLLFVPYNALFMLIMMH